ncbi:MAG: choice-of-anchor D domain-containing protein, partial [Micromonosporaceae bacterium]
QETINGNTVGGGVFKWNGSVWTQVNGTVPNNLSNQSARRVQALAIDSRLNPPVVYAGTQGEGVFKSTDGGVHWTRTDNPANQGFRSDCLEQPEILALAVDETIPLVGTVSGTDGAVLYAGAAGEIGNTGCDPTPAGGGHQGKGPGFFRYVPNGILGCTEAIGCWDRRMAGAFEDLLPATVSAQVWSIALKTEAAPPPQSGLISRIFIGTDVGVFTSNDSAGNWDGVPNINLPDGLIGLPIRALGIDPNASCSGDTVRLFAGSAGRGMFSRCPNSPVGNHAWTATNGGLTAIRALSVAVASRSDASSKIYAGLSGGGVISSVDGGTTWQSTGESELTVRGLAPDPGIADTVYAATGKGVIKTANGGATWTPASAGLPLECNFSDPAAQQRCLIKQDPNDPNPPRTVRSILVDPADTGVVFAAVGGIHASVDGGATWTPRNGDLPDLVKCGSSCPGNGIVSAFAVDHHAPGGDPGWGTLYLGADGSDFLLANQGQGVFRSTDGGVTWTAVNTNIAATDRFITALALDPLPQGGASVRLYAGTTTGKVYRTDNGVNWLPLSNNLPGNAVKALAIEMADPRVIYAALDGGGVYVSPDEGFTWTALTSGLSSLALNVVGLAVDSTQDPHALYAATLGGGMHDFQVEPPSHPFVFINDPPGPYPQQAAASPIEVSGTLAVGPVPVSKVIWSTNRGHAGLASGTTPWTASVLLEPGLNAITVTAVDTASSEGSSSLTVMLPYPVPQIFVSPLSIPFGTVPVGSPTAVQNVTVRNDGTADLILGTVTLGGANANQFKKPVAKDLCSGQTLAPAATCTVGVKFKAKNGGAQSATLVIPSNDPNEPTVTVALSGTANGPEISVTPTSLDFGTVAVGTVTSLQAVTVGNDGTTGLVLGSVTLGGANPGEFKKPAGNDFCSGVTLAPGATCTVSVKFRPASAGPKSATLVIPSDDLNESSVTVLLGGTGQ